MLHVGLRVPEKVSGVTTSYVTDASPRPSLLCDTFVQRQAKGGKSDSTDSLKPAVVVLVDLLVLVRAEAAYFDARSIRFIFTNSL